MSQSPSTSLAAGEDGRRAIHLGQSDDWARTLVYGFAHLGKSLFWYASELLFAFYLTEMTGLDPAHMGWILALGLMISALIDLIAGPRLSRHLPDACAAAQLQFLGSVLCGLSFAAVFAGFWIPPDIRFAHALAAGVAFRCAYALYDLPQNTLMSLATVDEDSRNRVAAVRIWFSGTAILLISGAIAPLISERGEGGASLFLGFAVAVSLIAIVSAGWLAWRLGGAGPARRRSPSRPAAPRTGGWSREFALLMALMAITSLASPLFSKVEPYFVAYVLQAPALGGGIMASMAIGVMLGQPVWAFLSLRSSRYAILALAAVLEIFGLVLIAISGAPVWALFLAAFAFGLGNGGIGMVLWAGFSAVVARDAAGLEAGAFGLFTALAKTCLAAGGLLLGLMLAAHDYRGGGTGVIVLLMAGVPAAGALACLALAWLWRCLHPAPLVQAARTPQA